MSYLLQCVSITILWTGKSRYKLPTKQKLVKNYQSRGVTIPTKMTYNHQSQACNIGSFIYLTFKFFIFRLTYFSTNKSGRQQGWWAHRKKRSILWSPFPAMSPPTKSSTEIQRPCFSFHFLQNIINMTKWERNEYF
jgi:hypothetical protein